ncbi:MAG: peptidylprolyl isomerase [Sphingobium sp.]|nr:MAG: peptidylprolyl isomerase [Sphingobium sp.]
MLSFFRRFVGSKVGAFIALGFLALIALAFAAGDITGSGGLNVLSGDGGVAARAGSHRLAVTDLQSRTQRVFEQARRSNPGMDVAAFLAEGGVDQVYDQLVAGLTVSEFGRQEGMGVSKRMVDGQIAAIPAFQDASGNFSQSVFRQLLSREGVSEKALREDITRDLMGKQVVGPATLGVRLPDSLVLPYASLLLEAREGRIAAIPAVAFAPTGTPTDKQIADYYKANAARFTVPEQRRLRYAVIDLDRFSAAAQPTDAEIAAYFNQNKAAYAASETRSFEQLILPTEAAAKAIAADVGKGKTLAAAAQGAGLSVSTLADMTQEKLGQQAATALVAPAFSAAQGALVGPARGGLGWVLLKVSAINRKPAQTLDQAKAGIVTALKAQKEQKLLADFTAKIEDQVANGATFDEVVKDNALTGETTPALLSTGQSVQTQGYAVPADVRALLAAGFQMDADDDAQIVPVTPDKRYALLDVAEVIAAAPPPLAKVREAVVAQYRVSQGDAKAKAIAEQIQAKVAKGTTLEAALAAVGATLPPVEKVGGRRADLMRGDQKAPPPLMMLFSMPRGSVKMLPIDGGRGYFLVQLDKVIQSDAARQPQLVEQVRQQLDGVFGNEYADQLERAIEKDLKVKRYPQAVAQVKAELVRANGGAGSTTE